LYSGAILVILSLFTLPVSVWYFVKPHLQNANEGKNHKFELSRLKNNAEIFYAMLEKQKEIDQNTTGLGVTIGKIDSPNTIIKVCNPHCNPCSEAHPEIEKLLDSNVKIQIIYNASNYDHDITRLPAKHFLAIANKNDPALLLKVLNDWYSDKNKNYEKFAVKYPVQNLEAQVAKIDEMHQWCNDNAVSFTPTYFFNGRQLPSLYKLADLKYFLGNN
jgi:thiol-disulfide isomerase/thioredoxin